MYEWSFILEKDIILFSLVLRVALQCGLFKVSFLPAIYDYIDFVVFILKLYYAARNMSEWIKTVVLENRHTLQLLPFCRSAF